jgi:hypothetical protein
MAQGRQLRTIIAADALYELSEQERQLVWTMRHHLVVYSTTLPKFLRSGRQCHLVMYCIV